MARQTGELRASLRLLAIVDDSLIGPDALVSAGVEAARAGVTSLQLRAKSLETGVMVRVARDLVSSTAVPVFINDRVDVALAAGAHGVHLGSDDMPVEACPKHSRSPAVVDRSFSGSG